MLRWRLVQAQGLVGRFKGGGTVIAALGSGKGVLAGSPVISGAGVARSRKGRRKKGADGSDR